MSDHRTGKRFPLELPIKIHKEQEGSDHKGMTGNLSAAGVYIKADASLELGSAVEFEIALPPEMRPTTRRLSGAQLIPNPLGCVG